jgi:hypothetical protein
VRSLFWRFVGHGGGQHLLRHGRLAVGVQDGDFFHCRRAVVGGRQRQRVVGQQQGGGDVAVVVAAARGAAAAGCPRPVPAG